MEDQKIPFKMFLPGIAWFFIVALLTLLPGSDIPAIGWLENMQFDKIIHAGLFGGLTFLFSLPYFKANFSIQRKINYFIRIAMAASIWGLTVEFIQKFFIPGRDFDLLDWAADSVGVIIAFWLCKQILKYLNTKNLLNRR